MQQFYADFQLCVSNPPIWVLILVQIIGVVGMASVPLVQAALSEDPPKLSRPCIEIASSYIDKIKNNPEMRELILPGKDGRSIVNADPKARICGIKPEVLEGNVNGQQ